MPYAFSRLQELCHKLFNSVIMRKQYFHPFAQSVSVTTFVIAASGESRRSRKATDFNEDDYDYDGEGSNWNIWNK